MKSRQENIRLRFGEKFKIFSFIRKRRGSEIFHKTYKTHSCDTVFYFEEKNEKGKKTQKMYFSC
jgi:hypothetical protein